MIIELIKKINWLKDQRLIGRFKIKDKSEDNDLSTVLNQIKLKLESIQQPKQSVEDFLKERYKTDFNSTQLINSLNAIEQEILIILVKEYSSIPQLEDDNITMLKDWFTFIDDNEISLGIAECPNCGDTVVYDCGCVKCNANFIFKSSDEKTKTFRLKSNFNIEVTNEPTKAYLIVDDDLEKAKTIAKLGPESVTNVVTQKEYDKIIEDSKDDLSGVDCPNCKNPVDKCECTKELFSKDSKGAVLSECGVYRYQLWRIWDDSKPKVMFIMLNPSTADASDDDPTIRRCIGFAKSWGYGGLYVGNLFAFRATNPKDLLQVIDPIGKDNLVHLACMRDNCDMVVLAWGNSRIEKSLLSGIDYKPLSGIDPYYIDLSIDGTPKHPLYLKSDLKPKRFTIKAKVPAHLNRPFPKKRGNCNIH